MRPQSSLARSSDRQYTHSVMDAAKLELEFGIWNADPKLTGARDVHLRDPHLTRVHQR